jgi:hypothetical protein
MPSLEARYDDVRDQFVIVRKIGIAADTVRELS